MKRVANVLVCVAFVATLVSVFGSGAAAESQGRSVYALANKTNAEVARKLQLAEANLKFLSAVRKRAHQLQIDARFQQEIRNYPAGEKMKVFMAAVSSPDLDAMAGGPVLQNLKSQRGSALQNAQTGSISGTVLVEGAPTFDFIEVIAFDAFGFFAAASSSDGAGNYTIAGLDAGSYYVVTQSGFVDELYNDVLLDDFKNWRDATLVDVVENGSAPGIDFDLQRGAQISGKVLREDGVTPLAFTPVTFEVFRADNPFDSRESFATTGSDGSYTIGLPATGTFKIRAEAAGFAGEFWNDKADFDSADPIIITTLDDDIPDIDFSLSESGAAVAGAVITGTVLGPDDVPLLLSFIFAFDIADTSIAGLGISGFSGEYEVPGLDAGSYIMYANNFTGFLAPPSVRGEYYEEAETSAAATPVTVVAETDSVGGIDFTLDAGAAISGIITDDTGAPLDSVIVVGVKLDLDSIDKFFFDSIDFGLTFSDVDGNYVLGGLSGGDYVLRTVTLIGPNAGLVIDEYYQDVQSLFDFPNAMPVAVTVPDTTTDIDFELQRGGRISGHFFETDGSTPVMGEGFVLAFNAATGLPEIALPEFNSADGSYEVGPLPSGDFKLLGIVGVDLLGGAAGLVNKELARLMSIAQNDDVIYLPQFYDGQTSLQEADLVPVTAPNTTSDIDFKMVRAGFIQGVVSLEPGFPAGADSVGETLVVAYHATGEVAGGSDVTFAGGYLIAGLPPGDYKVQALTAAQGYAATYHGGGLSFDADNSLTVTVSSDAVITADIDLATGEGIISGTVTDAGGATLDGVLVLAYDQTGHVLSAGISGIDPDTERPLGTGEYFIPGLGGGDYFIRTFSLFQIILQLENADTGDLGGDPLSLLSGLLGSSADLLDNLNIQLHGDIWYPNIPIEIDLGGLDIFSLLFALVASDGDPVAILPFSDSVPGGAGQVSVSSPGLTSNVDLSLPDLADVLTAVETSDETLVPGSFTLSQNYPNPFNPSTLINYEVPGTSFVSLRIYNLLGQRMRTLFEGVRAAGSYSIQWDGLNDSGEQVAAGLYFLRMKTDNLVLSRKMLLVK